jgi:hypothetical protein
MQDEDLKRKSLDNTKELDDRKRAIQQKGEDLHGASMKLEHCIQQWNMFRKKVIERVGHFLKCIQEAHELSIYCEKDAKYKKIVQYYMQKLTNSTEITEALETQIQLRSIVKEIQNAKSVCLHNQYKDTNELVHIVAPSGDQANNIEQSQQTNDIHECNINNSLNQNAVAHKLHASTEANLVLSVSGSVENLIQQKPINNTPHFLEPTTSAVHSAVMPTIRTDSKDIYGCIDGASGGATGLCAIMVLCH